MRTTTEIDRVGPLPSERHNRFGEGNVPDSSDERKGHEAAQIVCWRGVSELSCIPLTANRTPIPPSAKVSPDDTPRLA